jgi:anti-sigma B factor antagonist
MSNLVIKERRVNNVLILDVNGKLRLGAGSAEFHTAIRLLAERGEKNILVNLNDVSYIDSSGLGELVAGYVALQKSGGELKLLHLTSRVRELMIMTKLLTVFDAYENEAEAVESFENSSVASTGQQLFAMQEASSL